jgi:hypothetical protein
MSRETWRGVDNGDSAATHLNMGTLRYRSAHTPDTTYTHHRNASGNTCVGCGRRERERESRVEEDHLKLVAAELKAKPRVQCSAVQCSGWIVSRTV